MRVFILQRNSRYNTSPAKKYGDIVYVTDRHLNPFYPDSIIPVIRSRLRDEAFDRKTDCICLTGPSILLAEFLAIAAHDYGRVKVLMFHAPDSSYRLEVIDLNGSHRRTEKPIRESSPTECGSDKAISNTDA